MGVKVQVENITNITNASGTAVANENFDTLADEFDNVLYKDGSVVLDADLDMDSNRLLNLPDAVTPGEPITYRQALEEGFAGPKGDPGPAGNVAASLSELKGAATTNKTMIYDGNLYTWTLGDYSSATLSDQLDYAYVKADSTSLATGAWVLSRSAGYILDQSKFDSSMAVGGGLRKLRRTAGATGKYNTTFGVDAGRDLTAKTANANPDSGYGNSVFGSRAFLVATNAWDCTVFGYEAMISAVDTVNCTAIAPKALYSLTEGVNAIAIGTTALFSGTLVQRIVAIGVNSGYFATTAVDDVYVGDLSGYRVTTGSKRVGIGALSLGGLAAGATNGSEDTAVGYRSLAKLRGGGQNGAFGASSLVELTDGTGNNAFGANSLSNITTTNNSAAFGDGTLQFATVGEGSAFGSNAGNAFTTATGVCVGGYQSFRLATTANGSTGWGWRSGYNITVGQNDTCLGLLSGQTLTNASNCTMVGANADGAAGADNQTSLGAGATCNAANQVTLGNTSVTDVRTAAPITAANDKAVPAGGSATVGIKVSSTANLGFFVGTGAPTMSAAKGSLYSRTDGSSTTTRLYVNTDGGTTWTNVTTAA